MLVAATVPLLMFKFLIVASGSWFLATTASIFLPMLICCSLSQRLHWASVTASNPIALVLPLVGVSLDVGGYP